MSKDNYDVSQDINYKWYRNKEMLEGILKRNNEDLQKRNSTKVEALLKDETNLIQDHLELLERLEQLEKENKLFDETIEADDRIICQLTSELDIFKLAFYTLWKCCNSNDIATDVEETDNYIEFRCGYESLCIPATQQEIESIEKATELLDINVNEVLGE